MEYNYTETEMFDDLDNLRESGTETSKTAFIKKFSNNYDPDLLETLIKDIDLYLFIEKDIKESEFSNVDVDNAIKSRLENGLEVPYYKSTLPINLTEKQKEFQGKLESTIVFQNAKQRINTEALLFPFEFLTIHHLKKQVKEKILELQTAQNQHAPTDPAPKNEVFEIGFNFINTFDSVAAITVYKYFSTELVDKQYLSKEKLEQFLISAFQENNEIIEKLHFDKIKTQAEIIKIFYRYYKTIAQKPYGKKNKYLKLLTNYFIGYDFKTIDSNFSK